MTRTKKLCAEAVGKIINRHDRDHVGNLYKWNNRELQKAWFDRPCADVVVEMFEMDVPKAS